MDIRTELKELMESRGFSTSFVATAIGVAKSAVNMWINDKYNGDNVKLTDKINNFIQRERERANNEELPFVDISFVKYISEIARLCHTKGKIGVCVGRAGLGKTVAVKEYTKNFLDAVLIESDSGYTAKSLLLEIHRRVGLSGKGSTYDLMNEVIHKLYRSGRLLIIDEAENLPYRALEIARRIHDKTGIGILLIGRNILFENLCGSNNEYDQLYSRVKYHKKLDDRLLLQDVRKILTTIGQDPDLADTYLLYSDGITRKLEHLITHSTYLAKINGKDSVDSSVIKKTSELLMVRSDWK